MRLMASVSIAALIGAGLAVAASPAPGQAQVIGVGVRAAPPRLPVYPQPPVPGYGYIWTPGYWAWDDYSRDYFWVPGCWVEPPTPRLLWTPGYWAWQDGAYVFNTGYWGSHVGFYGGIDYGYGYSGYGYAGGYWNGDRFFYNRSIDNVDTGRISTVYAGPAAGRAVASRVSFNGGPGGVRARADARELAGSRETHVPATAGQLQQRHLASAMPVLRASVNHGRPPIAATQRAAVMRGAGVVGAGRTAPRHAAVARSRGGMIVRRGGGGQVAMRLRPGASSHGGLRGAEARSAGARQAPMAMARSFRGSGGFAAPRAPGFRGGGGGRGRGGGGGGRGGPHR